MLINPEIGVLSYFESKSHASFIGHFLDEDYFDACSEELDKIAAQDRMTATESVLDGSGDRISESEVNSCEYALLSPSEDKAVVVAMFVEQDIAQSCLRILNRNSTENFTIVKIS